MHVRILTGFTLLAASTAGALSPAEPNLGATVYLDVQTIPATAQLSWWGQSGCHYVVETTLEMGTPWIVLKKQTRQSPPGNDLGVAGPENDASGSGFTAWDVSRQRTIRALKGPNLMPADPADGFPYAEENYPANLVEGNDDSRVLGDEDSDPYIPGKGAVGELISTDKPIVLYFDILDAINKNDGFDGDRMHYRIWFREFSRLQIGSKWYKTSEYQPWRFQFFVQRTNGEWHPEPNTQEIFDTSNGGIP